MSSGTQIKKLLNWTTGAGDTPGAFASTAEAEAILQDLAGAFFQNIADSVIATDDNGRTSDELPNLEAQYRVLVEQIPAVVFMAYLDKGIGEAYVSPQIEASLGFTQSEWLEDPVRWYQQIHPDDKQRWSIEAAGMFLSGEPLRSAYRVIARDGRVIWFHCEAKMIRREDGRPWFIHGVAFDITDLKRTEAALQEERNVVSAILHTVGALVVVMDRAGRIIRFNRACELTTGHSFDDVRGCFIWELFSVPEEAERFRESFERLCSGQLAENHESYWATRDGVRRLIAWSSTVLPGADGTPVYVIATGIDVTERKRLEKAILEISTREQRRIGQDLHDGLGQHLTGIAFMTKAQEQKLAEKSLPEALAAAKIVRLVNQAIDKTRELARGLAPVMSDAHGLMSSLQQCASEAREVFGASVRFQCERPVLVHDVTMATHLYHIVQEALNNAIKHGKAKHVLIILSQEEEQGTLTIKDDGAGIPDGCSERSSGMGLHIMHYRARMIGGSLEVGRAGVQGTVVNCIFPMRNKPGAVA